MRFKLTAGLVVAVLSAWIVAGPIASSGAWTLGEESGGIGAVGSGEGEGLPGGTGVAPGAIEPLPVNQLIEEESEADPPWQQAQEKEEREDQEREAAQQVTAEREAKEAKEAKEREEAEAAALRCVVPSLKGDTLAHARQALRGSHCTLGNVHFEHGHHSSFVVRTESPAPGRALSAQAPVGITLGPAKRHRG